MQPETVDTLIEFYRRMTQFIVEEGRQPTYRELLKLGIYSSLSEVHLAMVRLHEVGAIGMKKTNRREYYVPFPTCIRRDIDWLMFDSQIGALLKLK
jgi:hypothetical protein